MPINTVTLTRLFPTEHLSPLNLYRGQLRADGPG